MLLTHARCHFDEDFMFARFGDITLAELERLANFGDEDRLLLSCHVVLFAVSDVSLFVVRLLCHPLLSLHALSRYLYEYHITAHVQRCITIENLAFAARSKCRAAKQPKHIMRSRLRGWAVFCLQSGRRESRNSDY